MSRWFPGTVFTVESTLIALFLKTMAEKAVNLRRSIEMDLLSARIVDNDLGEFGDLLRYLNFEVWEIRAGWKLPEVAQGDRLVTDIKEMPCCFAAVFCETAEKAMRAGQTDAAIDKFAMDAHEYLWWMVDSSATLPKIEIWQFPWPVFGIPADEKDISIDEVDEWLEYFSRYKSRESLIAQEEKRWAHMVKTASRQQNRMSADEMDKFMRMIFSTWAIFTAAWK